MRQQDRPQLLLTHAPLPVPLEQGLELHPPEEEDFPHLVEVGHYFLPGEDCRLPVREEVHGRLEGLGRAGEQERLLHEELDGLLVGDVEIVLEDVQLLLVDQFELGVDQPGVRIEDFLRVGLGRTIIVRLRCRNFLGS